MNCDELNCCKGSPFNYTAVGYKNGYYNTEQTFRATCGEGYVGAPVVVTMGAELYHSNVSQAEADAAALAAAQEAAEASLSCMAAT